MGFLAAWAKQTCFLEKGDIENRKQDNCLFKAENS